MQKPPESCSAEWCSWPGCVGATVSAFNVAGHDEHPDESEAAAASFSAPLRRMLSFIKGRKDKISDQIFKKQHR